MTIFINWLGEHWVDLILILILVIVSMYNKIKYDCMKKAAEYMVSIECQDFSGREKIKMVDKWINSKLPGIFNNSLINNLIDRIVKYIYTKGFSYMEEYIKRKTGLDLDTILKANSKAEEGTNVVSITKYFDVYDKDQDPFDYSRFD